MLKRFLDVTFSALALLLLSPAFIAVALVVRAKLGSPIFFAQTRSGLHGKPFKMFKFRTMTDARDATGKPLPDAERMTGVGAFLRGTSLDELPELWNVLRGEMSIVGPRPLLMEYLPRYTPFQARRNEVRPGITGLAQVNGRNSLTWNEKFIYDVSYVENKSTQLDIKIIVKTILSVLRRENISSDGHATMPEFHPEEE